MIEENQVLEDYDMQRAASLNMNAQEIDEHNDLRFSHLSERLEDEVPDQSRLPSVDI